MEYYEYNANNPKNNDKGGRTFIILKRACVYVILIAAALFIILLPCTAWEGVSLETVIIYNILIILLVELPPLGLYFLFRKLSNRYFEYDYFIYGDLLKIVRISNKADRKVMMDVNLCDIENVGIYLSDTYSTVSQSAHKVHSFACNADSPFYAYISANCGGKQEILIIEYDYAFVTALRRMMKRESAFDKDLILILRKTEKENAKSQSEEQSEESKFDTDKPENQNTEHKK